MPLNSAFNDDEKLKFMAHRNLKYRKITTLSRYLLGNSPISLKTYKQ